MPATYPFDPTGAQSTNRITGEQHIITPVNYRDYSFLVPRLAPFFATSLQISFRDQDNNVVPLTEGVDWYLSHWFISASRACSKPIYGSISFLNRDLNGVVTLNYQTIGGDWNLDENHIAQIMADRVYNPRTTSWDSVSEMPYSFPVVDHEWDLVDMIGMGEVVDSLEDIKNAILATSEGGIEQHILDQNNPHRVTAAQLGLGLVRNLSTALDADALDGFNDSKYMTPWSTHLAISNRISSGELTEHIANTSNPHHVSAEQTGAYTKEAVNALLESKLEISGTASNTLKFDGKTAQQWIDSLSVGSVENANKFNNMTYQEVVEDILSQTSANSEKLEGKTYDELKDEWESFTALDSHKLEGRTVTEIKEELKVDFVSIDAISALARQFEFFPDAPEVGDTNTHIWTKLATIYIDETFDIEYRYAVGEFFLSGGLSNVDKDTSLVHVKASTIGSENLSLNVDATILTDGLDVSKLNLGYTFEPLDESGSVIGSFVIWVKTIVGRRNITITELSKNSLNFNYVDEEPAKVEPVGITYINTFNSYVNKATFTVLENDVSDLTDVVSDNTSDISLLQTGVSEMSGDLADLTSDFNNLVDSLTTTFNALNTP